MINRTPYDVKHPRAAALGLRVRVEFDQDGDMYAIYCLATGECIDSGIICLEPWLDRFAEDADEFGRSFDEAKIWAADSLAE